MKRDNRASKERRKGKILIILGQYVAKKVNGTSCDETLATAALHQMGDDT